MTAVLEAMRAQPMAFPLDVRARRVAIDGYMGAPLVDGTAERDATLGGRPAAWIAPTGRAGQPGSGPVVLYLHGGAYEIGSIHAYRRFASELAVLLYPAV